MPSRAEEFHALLVAAAGNPELSHGAVTALTDACEHRGAPPATVAALRDAAATLESGFGAAAGQAWNELPRLERLVQSKRQTAWKREHVETMRQEGRRLAEKIIGMPAAESQAA